MSEQLELFTCDWGVNSGYKALQEKLDMLIPFEGSVEKPRSANKHLEKYRVASNLLYDLFNNGLMNKRSHFNQFFGFVPLPGYGYDVSRTRWQQIEAEMEPIFTEIMIKAGQEQGVC